MPQVVPAEILYARLLACDIPSLPQVGWLPWKQEFVGRLALGPTADDGGLPCALGQARPAEPGRFPE